MQCSVLVVANESVQQFHCEPNAWSCRNASQGSGLEERFTRVRSCVRCSTELGKSGIGASSRHIERSVGDFSSVGTCNRLAVRWLTPPALVVSPAGLCGLLLLVPGVDAPGRGYAWENLCKNSRASSSRLFARRSERIPSAKKINRSLPEAKQRHPGHWNEGEKTSKTFLIIWPGVSRQNEVNTRWLTDFPCPRAVTPRIFASTVPTNDTLPFVSHPLLDTLP